MMFRWDARQKGGKAWLLLALGVWVVVGLLAERSGRAVITADTVARGRGTGRSHPLCRSAGRAPFL